ncbi:unnamed protein product [Effrenium voratum]|uniref:SET domain-containing protein n=1 Tax=Effrenium voratum TaxID=2562239 RepID=A0AA36JKI3_9DINO|nr:unnamed protein product [Effrenium voratum]
MHSSAWPRKASMIPAVMRNDPCLAARPQLRREMEAWWAGSLWDPRSPALGSGEFFGTDFTCSSSMRDVLATLRRSDGERLSRAVAQGDLQSTRSLRRSAGDATPALHLALEIGAAPETVDLLAAACDHLNVWLPEPVVVTWARASCRAALDLGCAKGAVARLDALLWAGADVNSVGRGSETALHIVARTLQLLLQESRRYAVQHLASVRHELQDTVSELRQLYHDLVARGADAGMLDREGLTAVERLSEMSCSELLAAKRRSYGTKRYREARWQAPRWAPLSLAILARGRAVGSRRGCRCRRFWRSWAERLGVEAPKVELATLQDAFGNELRGMRATDDIPSEEPIITVPANCALQVTTAGPCPGDFVAEEVWQKLPWWAQLAVLVLREVKQPRLAEWAATLPQSFEEIPLNWTNEELAWLEYPALLQQIEKQRQEIEAAFRDASASSLSFTEAEFLWAVQLVRSRAFSGPYEGRQAQDRAVQLAFIGVLLVLSIGTGFVTPENGVNGALAAAIAIPLTDFLVGQTSSLKRHVVCPVVDYLNHDGATISDIAYEYFGDAFVVRINGGFKEGEEVCINYGEQRSNDTLLQFYGFVERDNANDTYTMDILRHLDEEAAKERSLEVPLPAEG